MVKDPADGRIFQFEEWEEGLLSLIDGTRDLHELADEFAARRPDKALDLQAMADYVESLRLTGILERTAQESHLVMLDKLKMLRRRRFGRAEVVSTFQVQFKLHDPDAMMNRVMPWIRWWWSPACVAGWLVVFTVVLGFLLFHWDLYWAGFFGLIDPAKNTLGDWVGLFVLVFAVSIWHELGHGFTVKRFGGEVHDIGFMFFYFEPAFYCNVNDSYLFPSTAQRIWCALGGLYFELMLCSVAVASWLLTPAEWWVHGFALTLVFITGLGGLFNMNPLMKLDGYYVLMDWLDVPELRERSFAFLSAWVKKHVLRLEVPTTPVSRWRRRVYLVYGIVAILYTTLALLFVYAMFRGWFLDWFGPAGYLVLASIILYLFRRKLIDGFLVLRHVWLDKRELLRVPRHRWIGGGIVVALLAVLAIPRTPTRLDARFVVEPCSRAVVRAPAAAMVRRVDVGEGRTVRAGDPLGTLDSIELRASHRRAKADRVLARRRVAVALERRDAEAAQEWQIYEREAIDREATLAAKIGALELRAPIDGVVATPLVERTVGRYLDEGAAFCTIDQLAAVELTITSVESDIEEVLVGTRARMLVTAFPFRTLRASVLGVSPVVGPPALAAEQAPDLVRPLSLLQARVRVENPGAQLRPGMSGRVQFLGRSRSALGKVWRAGKRWATRVLW